KDIDSSVPAQMTAYSPNEVEVEMAPPAAGWLILADAYDPGWKAWVNGAETPIERSLFALRGVAVPVGNVHVQFRYRPRYYGGSLLVSLGTLFLLVLGGIYLSRSRFLSGK